MFRLKTISTISNITQSSIKSLQNRDSLFQNNNKRNSNRNSRSTRNSKSIRNSRSIGKLTKKKQKRDVELSVTLGEVYLIVHLCSNEVIKRGLTEPDIFSPVRFRDDIETVRCLINNLLRDNRIEFEDELKFQNIHNIIVGIRMALRNCDSNIVSYEDYEEFVKHEREWQYDPKNGSFNQFLLRLPRKNKGILIELFDLFAMAMENSHVNQMHPIRIIKSMSLHIFNESQTKNYKNFQFAYRIWLKYSNATIHLFLSYIRERAYLSETELPERLNLLLQDYVERREQCFTTSLVCESGKEIVFGDHFLPDITIADLEHAEKIFKQSDSEITFTSKSIGNSLYDSFPEMMETFLALKQRKKSFESSNPITLEDPEIVETKWEELQNKGLNLLSEEVLKLLFDYDDIVSIDFNGGKKKRNLNPRKTERLSISEPILPFSKVKRDDDTDSDDYNSDSAILNNNNENVEWEDFSKKGFRESVNLNSTIDPALSYLSDIGENSPIIELSKNELKEKKNRKNRKLRKFSSLLCFKCTSHLDYLDEQEHSNHIYDNRKDWQIINKHKDSPKNSHLSIETIDALFPYVLVETNTEGQDECLDEWVIIVPRTNLEHENDWIIIEDKNKLNNFLYQENILDSMEDIEVSNRISSISSVYTPSILPSTQQFDHDIEDDLTKPQEPYFERPANSTKRMVELHKDDDYYYQEKASQLYQIQKQKFYLYQEDYFNHSPYPSVGRQSPALSIQSSNMSDSSIISMYGNIVRGKDLPYPITPIGRQSSIRRQLGSIPANSKYFDRETPTRLFQSYNNLIEYETIETPYQSEKI